LGIYIYNEDQIGLIGRACSVVARVLDEIGSIIDENVTTHDLDSYARKLIKESGGIPAFLGYRGYPAAVCTSINEVVIHGIPRKDIKLRNGDIIGVDVGVLLNGYYGDGARTYSVGSVNEKAGILMKAAEGSLYDAISKCRVGGRISDISNAIETHVTKFGFSPVRDFAGHGIGRNLHEDPSIPNYGSPGRGVRISNGMVLAIETMINMGTYMVEVLDDDWTVVTKDRNLSAHFEHTVAVQDGESVILTVNKLID
jgi:methionyl aminopeptidase